MRKLTLFTAAALSITSLGGFSLPAQAAQAGQQGSYKNVIVIQGNGLSDLQSTINNLKNQYPGILDCLPIPPSCIPGQPTPPGNGTPDNTPDSNLPGGNDSPDTDLPGGNDTPDTDRPGGNGTPDTDRPGGNGTPDQGPDTDQPDTDETPDDNTQLTYAEQVVYLVNAERKKQGLSALTIREDVRAAAQVRAMEIQTSFSHTRPDGQAFSSALREQNVSFRGSGENIAWGQKSPEEVVTGWMNSEGHRANILNASFTSIGVGHYQNASGVNYWTQLFVY